MPDPAQDNTPNILATASLVCGALSVVLACCCYGAPFNLLGLVLGIVAVALGQGSPDGAWRTYAYAGIGLSLLSFLLAFGLLFVGFGVGMLGGILEQL